MERSIEHIGMKPESGIIVYALHYHDGKIWQTARAYACAAGDPAREGELEDLLWEEGRRFVALSAESAAKGHPAPTDYILARNEYIYDIALEMKGCRVLAALSAGKEKEWRGGE